VPFTGLSFVRRRISTPRASVIPCALAGALLLVPATAGAAEYKTASGPRDAGGPKVSTAMTGDQLYFDGRRKLRFLFRVEHSEPVRATIAVTRPRSGEVVDQWRQTVTDDSEQAVRWNGTVDKGLPEERKYAFRLVARDTDGDETYSADSDDTSRDAFKLRHNRFPVRGRHDYWDGFGAGRGHQGTDVGAKCGTRLQAAHGGKVQFAGYHGAAGHYLVIDGRRTKEDYAYMHLQRPPDLRDGNRVKAGQTIGRVGESGNASGCHLHFEMWSKPGWYEGGSAFDSEPHLRRWDRYS
jgi:murein DD-endopeptidase MepM/ murein hydrolase activator NlpD